MQHSDIGGRAALTVNVAGGVHTVRGDDGPVVIGRESPAQIRVEEPGISRSHLRLEFGADCWTVTDVGSRNGTYLDGARIDTVAVRRALTVHLGHPEGVAVHLDPAVETPVDEPAADGSGVVEPGAVEPGAVEPEAVEPEADPGLARAGMAVAVRREELGLSHQELSEELRADRRVGAETLATFERGRHWPGEGVASAIEQSLRWPPGTIDRIRSGAAVPDDLSTEVLSPTVQVALIVDAADIALRGVRARAALLPAAAEPGFAEQIPELLTELRRLERTAEHALRVAPGRPHVASTLGAVRRLYTELSWEAARSMHANLGQRLQAVRLRARLTVPEAAAAAGVTVDDIAGAEEGRPVDAAPTAAALQQFVDTLETGSA